MIELPGINWREESRPGQIKPAKVPVDLTTGERIDPLNSASQIPFAEAWRRDPQHSGIVLTEGCGYVCIDLDHCLVDGQWSPLALAVLAMFPGAYVEVSYSGDGLHIIFRGTLPAGYGTRGPGVECYTHSRFIAITGDRAQGDPNTDHTAALAIFASLYLKPAGVTVTPGEWTSAPCAGSNPIADDDALIARATNARASAGVAFGGKASFKDLWEGNRQALADAFPSSDPAKPYDASAADVALAAHLAFYTGKDCSRIERLMRRSGLVREKWDRRGDDYLKRTILGAVARVQKVYNVGAVPSPEDAARIGAQFMPVERQHEHFAGCCYVVGLHRVLMPNGDLLKPEQFNATMGGYEFQIAYDNARHEKKAFTAFTENRAARFPKADALCFRPELPPAALINEGGRVLVNSFAPVAVALGSGDPAPFLDLLQRQLPNDADRAIILAYMAAVAQHPGAKFQWAPLLQGVDGNGKNLLVDILEYAIGERYTHRLNASDLGNNGLKFTAWLERKLLVYVAEIYVSDRREVIDALKPLITDRRVEIQRKGVDQTTGDNRANFVLASNHRDAIQKTRNDRRYAIFYMAQQEAGDLERDGLTPDYFTRLYAWLRSGGFADVAGFLSRYQIPDALNPATTLNRAPVTSSTEAAIAESMGQVEQAILDAIEEERQGFRGGWISSIRLAELLAEIKRPIGTKKRGAILKSLGYIPHPAFPEGRASQPIIQEGGKRPTLYVREGTIMALNLKDGGPTIDTYMRAQSYGFAMIKP